jgi:hypothetical protein
MKPQKLKSNEQEKIEDLLKRETNGFAKNALMAYLNSLEKMR